MNTGQEWTTVVLVLGVEAIAWRTLWQWYYWRRTRHWPRRVR